MEKDELKIYETKSFLSWLNPPRPTKELATITNADILSNALFKKTWSECFTYQKRYVAKSLIRMC